MSLVNKKGVDLSSNNGDVSIAKIKQAGFDFVMIRCGYGSDKKTQDDTQFVNNVKKCQAAGVPWGVYLFSYALNADEAKSEVEHVDRLLKAEKAKGYRPTLPIALDVEWTEYHERNGAWNAKTLTAVATTFLDEIKKRGYYPMIYTGYSELDDLLSEHIRNDFDCWFAQWNSKPNSYKYNRLGIWQYGGETNYLESNSISGVGVVDKNICYKDYPTIIKSGGYNGWAKGSAASSGKTSSGNTSQSQSTSKTPTVATVQKWLNTNFNSKLDVDGIYGSLTKAALVKALQKTLGGLDVDGIFGYYTKNAVKNLSIGDTGTLVYILQGLLLCNGYGTGGFDGIFGSGTEAAVKSYQYQHGLEADGIAGRQTFESLCD